MKRLPLLLLLLALAIQLGATSQEPDVLKIGGDTYYLFTNPLTPFLDANPGRLPNLRGGFSSDLWRGYIATWSIRNRRLLVEDVRVRNENYAVYRVPESQQTTSVMQELFGDDEARLATWYTGHLIVPTGDLVDYVHMGYASTYSSYIVAKVVKGIVVHQEELTEITFRKFRRRQFAAWKKTPDYATALAETTTGEDAMTEEMAEQFLFEYGSEAYLGAVFDRGRP